MKKALRFTVVIAILVALALVVVACRNDEPEPVATPEPTPTPEAQAEATPEPTEEPGDEPVDQVELTFAWWGGDFRAEQTHYVLDMFIEQSDQVSYIHRSVASFADYWPMLAIQAAAGTLPDVMQQDVSRLLEYQASNLFTNMAPFIADGRINLTDIPQSVVDAGTIGGEVIALPIGMNVAAMLYNATLLEELGLEAPRNMTLDQFIELAETIYEMSGVRTNWAHNDPANQMEVHLRAQGVNFFEGNGLGATADHFVEFFATIARGINDGWHIRPEHIAGREGAEQNSMWYPPGDENANLRTWNTPVWSNMLNGYLHDSPEDMEIGMTTYPSNNPIAGNFGRASMFLSMTSHTNHPDAAASLISFWMNSLEAHEHMLGERGVIVNPVIAAAVYDQLDEGPRRQTEFVGWVNNGNSSPFNPTRPEGAAEVIAELNDVRDQVTHGNMTPEAAAEHFYQVASGILW
ncbi:MAG: extracellular solute-binding protein [Defluviitaleaceae bacterium]|nr:extracellular solute-binding protein [Defluviitaleaceae bacterium]